MKFSIITVCRNDVAAVEKTVRSVAQQTYLQREYIVVDGQSEDDTIARLQPFVDQGIIHTLVSEPDAGIYDAMNKGIAHATGDVLYFLNADDSFAHARVLKTVADFWIQTPEIDSLYGDINLWTAEGEKRSTVIYPEAEHLLEYLQSEWICHQALFVKRAAFDRIGGFDLQFQIAADYDWLFRALAQNMAFRHLPQVVADYVLGGISDMAQVRSLSEMFQVQNRFALYQTPEALQERVRRLQERVLEQQDGMVQLHHKAQGTAQRYRELKERFLQTRNKLKKVQAQAIQMRDRLQAIEASLDKQTEQTAEDGQAEGRSLWQTLKRNLGKPL
jgi:hypothetical protein